MAVALAPPFTERLIETGGKVGGMIAGLDWSATPLGPIETWPQSLKSTVDLMLASPYPVYVAWGPELTSLYNDSYAPLVGPKHPAGLGQPFAELWSDIQDEYRPLVEAVMAGQAQHFVDRSIRLSGDAALRYFTFSWTPLRDEAGQVCGFFCSGLETTERVEAELAFRRMFEASPTPLLVVTPDAPRFTIEYCNDALLATAMRARQDLLGRGVLEAFPDNPADPGATGTGNLRASLERALATKQPDVMPVQKYDIRRPDGTFEERWWQAANSPVLGEDGEVKVIIHHTVDVTGQHQAEERLRELNATLEQRVTERTAERNLLAKLVEMTDLMVMAVDLDYNILALNAANADEFERIYGIRPKPGDNMLELLADWPDHQEQVRAGWGRGMQGEQVTFLEDYGDPDRARPYYEVSFRPLRNDAGEQTGVYQFVADVTNRLRKEAQLAEAREALRQSQKMEAMGQLTGGVAHDMNNLLTPIVGTLDMLQRKGLGGEREQRLVAGAMQSAERAKTLVQRLLAFARRQPLQTVPVDIAKLVESMGELVSSTTGPQVKVVVEAPGGLPLAVADPNQLEMAILNLAVNARDAMQEGGTLRISATAETVSAGHHSGLRPGLYIRLSVADTGTGMEAATLARAVEPFFSTKGVGKGTGLGLSMVHGLASQLGGTLTIQSRPGLGTNVELWLPQSSAAPEVSEPAAILAEVPTARGTVLLVDDEQLVRMSTADMLSDLGYVVVEAASGEEAMQLAVRGERFDLLVTDHLMPGINGTDLARAVRTVRPGVPVLLVSGYAEREGVDPDLPRLTKPFRKDELAASLAQLVALS